MNEAEVAADNIEEQDDFARSQALQAQPDADPEKAAESIKIGKDLGVAPVVALRNFDNAHREHKAVLTNGFMQNEKLRDYVNSDPMAAKVSADDWGALDIASEALSKLRLRALNGPIADLSVLSKVFEGFKHGLEEDALFQYKDLKDPMVRGALQTAINMTPVGGVDQIFKAFNVLVHGFAAGAGEAHVQLGGDQGMGRRLTRDIVAAAQTSIPEFMRSVSPKVINEGLLRQMPELLHSMDPWIKAGIEPPVGVHQEIDKLKIEQAGQDAKNLDEAIKASKTATKQRSPELYQKFVEAHGEGEFGISAEAVRKLYGDKMPEPGDGLLGDLPNIAEQYRMAVETGGDVKVSGADFFAHMDEKVTKDLVDDVRVREGGLTVEEGKVLKESFMVEAHHGSPHEFDAFSMEKIGTGEGAQSYGHGLYFAENPQVAETYSKAGWKSTDTPQEGNKYRVRIHAEKEHFLDWDKPLGEQPHVLERLQNLRNKGLDIDPALFENRPGAIGQNLYTDLHMALGRGTKSEQVSATLHEAGIPGIKYLDQGSRGKDAKLVENVKKTLDETNALIEKYPEQRAELEARRDALEKELKQYEPTYNYVIFGDSIVEITHKNDVAVEGVRKQAGLTQEGWGVAETSVPADERAIQDRLLAIERVKGLEGGQWYQTSPTTHAYIRPIEKFKAKEAQLFEAIDKELERIAPKYLGRILAADAIVSRGKQVRGIYQIRKDQLPTIIWSLASDDPIGTARHEAIHHLRAYGFFTEPEWRVLERISESEGWNEKHGIDSRYPTADKSLKLEESIAEEFKDWNTLDKDQQAKHPVVTIFEKIKELVNIIRQAVREVFGTEPKITNLFDMIDSGEIGGREPILPKTRGAFFERTQEAKQGELDVTRMEDKPPFKGGAGIFTAKQMQKHLELVAKQRDEDRAYMLKQGEKLERKRQTREWKENQAQVEEEVRTKLETQPDIEAMRYFKYGIQNGVDTHTRPKLNERLLTPEQLKALPESYYRRDGTNPEDLAQLFGFKTGADLVEGLIALEQDRGETPLGRWYERKVAQATEAEMTKRYGDLDENIIAAAQEHVTGQTTFDLLHEETLALAARTNAEFSLTKDQIKAWTAESFDRLQAKSIKVDSFLNAAGKAGRAVYDAMLKGDFEAAFRAKQQQYLNMLYAKHAKEFKKSKDQFVRMADRFDTREPLKGVEQPYTNYIQALLTQVGMELKLSRDEISRGIEHEGYKSLDDFIDSRNSHGYDIDVPQDYVPKQLEKMTVAEFNELKDSIDSLYDYGREEKKINIAGDRRDYEDWRREAIVNLQKRPVRDIEAMRKGGRNFYKIDATLTRMEELVKDFDFREELGPFFDALIVPMALSKEKRFDMMDALGKRMKSLGGKYDKAWRKSLDESIPHDGFIWDPHYNAPYELTRWNLVKILLNWGNEENKTKVARGMASANLSGVADKAATDGVKQKLENLLATHIRKEDLEFAQHIWDTFEGFKPQIETMSRNVGAKLPKWVEASPISHPEHGDFAGGYFPLIKDRLRLVGKGSEREVERGPLGPDYHRATTSQRHLKERTGAAYWVDIDSGPEQTAGLMQQQIHDIAFRDSVIAASKVIYDPVVRNAITKHYGVEYTNQLEPWLKRVANEFTGPEEELAGWNSWGRMLRMNLTAAVLPLNYTVMLSPSPGTANPRVATAFYSNRSANMSMVLEKSHELKHLIYNLDRDITDKLKSAATGGTWSNHQAKIMEQMFRPLTAMEQELRSITFYGEYMDQLAKGRTDGEASLLADSMVRERHGAVSMVDLPALMASKNEFVKIATMFMGYFSTIRNWARQMPHAVREMEISNAAKIFWGTVLVPAAFNAALFTKTTENESWPSYIARSIMSTPFQMYPMVSGVWNYYSEGFQPRSPLFAFATSVGQVLKDGKQAFWDNKSPKHPIKDIAMATGQAFGVPGIYQIGRTAQFAADVVQDKQRPRNIIEWGRGILTGEARLKKK